MSITAVIVQARMGSSRLPGKVLMELAGHTVLAHVLERCRAIEGADVVCCATTTAGGDDPVADEAARCGVEVYRGSENDLLDRYRRAAVELGAEVVMRVTSDCPLIDPEVAAGVLRLRAAEGADYATNNMPPSWPHGLDCEAFTAQALARAAERATRPEEREHVTPWLRSHPETRLANLAAPRGGLAGHRWTLDYPEDLRFFEALFRYLPPPPARPGMERILAVLEEHPEIAAINRMRGDAARLE